MSDARTAEDLAREAADCIEDNALRGKELRTYLAAWLADCAVDGDLDAMRRARPLIAAVIDASATIECKVKAARKKLR